jgi:flagellar hook assembly protein FlgD
VKCHGEEHTPESYARSQSTGIPGQDGFIYRVRAYPSPSRGPTSILVELPEAAGPVAVTATIFDISGRRVREIRTETRSSGSTLLHWNGIDEAGAAVGSGVYLCRVNTDLGSWTGRFVVVR